MAGIIVDIDGTLLTGNNGIDKTVAWVNEKSKSYTIYLVTGRPEAERAKTTRALKSNGVKYNRLYMNDKYKDHEYTMEHKRNKATELLKNDNIVLAVDNDPDARAVYSKLGIPTKNPSSLPKTVAKIEGLWQGLF
jgi:ribonucleotide monophosphatase NagD (HAD superfamily)